MTKKKICFAVVAVILLAAAIGVVLWLSSLFPKADPIRLPDADSITAVSVVCGEGEVFQMGQEDGEDLLKCLRDAEPTREMSVNDTPTAEVYYIITVSADSKEYRYFLYEEDLHVYIESPYEGIYQTDMRALELVRVYTGD